jgi:hypothetical protein
VKNQARLLLFFEIKITNVRLMNMLVECEFNVLISAK